MNTTSRLSMSVGCLSIVLIGARGLAAEQCGPGEFGCAWQPSEPTQFELYRGPLDTDRPGTAFSTRMHLHGSFSEGTGSMSAGGAEARNVGVDVLWWSDHEYGIFHQRNITNFTFEDWWEYEWENEYWEPGSGGVEHRKYWSFDSADDMDSYEGTISDAQAWEGDHSMRLSASSSAPEFAEFLYIFDSDRSVIQQARTLAADIEIEIAIYPEKIGPDANAELLIALSKHGENPVNQLWIRYLLDNAQDAMPWRDGPVYNVPLGYTQNTWNRYALYVTRDVVEGFPELLGEDSTAHQIRLGVMSRGGADSVAYFDSFQMHFNVWYPQLYTRQRELLDQLEAIDAAPVHLQGVEVGGAQHLNMLSESTDLPTPEDNTGAAVARIHGAGGLVMLNHMFGFSGDSTGGIDPQLMLEELIAEDIYGADLLEVAYRHRGGHELPAHLWVWDELAKAGVYVVGTGTSDAHDWVPGNNTVATNNFLSWIYASEPNKRALIDGLRRGRIYFGDINQFDGRVELSTSTGFVMGQIVVTDKMHEQVRIDIDGLEAGDLVHVILDGAIHESFDVSTSSFSRDVDLELTANTCIRVEAYSPLEEENEKAFSNHLCFVKQLPGAGIAAARAGLDVAGFTSTLIDKFTITGFAGRSGAGSSYLRIDGQGEQGTVILESPMETASVHVVFSGLSGRWDLVGNRVVLWDLQGTGSAVVVVNAG